MTSLDETARKHCDLLGLNDCTCEFDPYEDCDEESWHFLRTCAECGHQWYGLHCPHDLYQNPCPNCGIRPKPYLERVKSIIRAMFDTEQERRKRWELKLNAYLKSVLRGEL